MTASPSLSNSGAFRTTQPLFESKRRHRRMDNLSAAEIPALDRAITAYKTGAFGEAEQLCQHIIAATPDFTDAVYLLGKIQKDLGKSDLALTAFDRAIGLRPGFPMAHFDRANVLETLGRHDEALASYDRAVQLRPDFAIAHFMRGNTLQSLDRHSEAVASYDRSIALLPDAPEPYSNRGNALQKLKRYDEAVASYDRAVQLLPDFPDAHSNRGGALHELARYDEALASYDRAIASRPDFAAAHYNRGTTFIETNRFVEAVASFDRAIAAWPSFAKAHLNRGNALQALGRHDEALVGFANAIREQPDFHEAHYNQALCWLLVGDFDRGWKEFEWRWHIDQLQSSKLNLAQELWLGQRDIAGKTVLLYCEQGFGDTIQFSRYAPLVAARGARVILQVQNPLAKLMTGLAGTTKVVARSSVLPEFDLQCPLFSLPLAFGTRLETIPPLVSGLNVSAESVVAWDKRLGAKNRPRIGLAWSGRPAHVNDRNRSIKLAALLPLLEFDATFVSLQKEVRSTDLPALKERSDLLDFGDELKDFADTAALIANLDLVISADTSVVHLAGALAKPVWVLLPFMPDWRWLLERSDSPWYPTARLFRQDNTKTWDAAVARVHAALGDFIQRSW
ncbi:MAG: tetratricopeptide repeat protein [Pseudolabrys sp.]